MVNNECKKLIDVFLNKGTLYNYDYDMEDIFGMIKYNRELPEINTTLYPDLLKDFTVTSDMRVNMKYPELMPMLSAEDCSNKYGGVTGPLSLIERYGVCPFYHNLLFEIVYNNKNAMCRLGLLKDVKVIVRIKDVEGNTLFLNSYTENPESGAKLFEFSQDRRSKFSVLDYLQMRLVKDIHKPENIFIKADTGTIIPTMAWVKMDVVALEYHKLEMTSFERFIIKLIIGESIPFIEAPKPKRVSMDNKANDAVVEPKGEC